MEQNLMRHPEELKSVPLQELLKGKAAVLARIGIENVQVHTDKYVLGQFS
jgi:ADP-dependent phosphofructokinase/glucokinase